MALNYVAIIVSAIIVYGLGYLWYSQRMFGKAWAKGVGLTAHKQKALAKRMPLHGLIGFIGTLFTATAVAVIAAILGAAVGQSGLAAGLIAALIVWIGFYAPSQLGPTLWEGKPWIVYIINVTYYLVMLAIIGVIVGLW